MEKVTPEVRAKIEKNLAPMMEKELLQKYEIENGLRLLEVLILTSMDS